MPGLNAGRTRASTRCAAVPYCSLAFPRDAAFHSLRIVRHVPAGEGAV